MRKGTRKNHRPAFKAKVALEAIKEQQTLSELGDRFQVHRNQIAQWKKQLLDRADEIFAKQTASDNDSIVRELHAKIGRLTMENDFLSGSLGYIGDRNPKR
ncbi:MAG: transposase [Deltaproteobacteria bacterium]|nr:transposase [Deltaproteobacteria bacterium]